MKIYKLQDDTTEVKDEISASEITDRPLKCITELKQGIKKSNRVNVFVDGAYTFSLDVAQVVELKVKVGMEIDEPKLVELKKASEFGKIYQRTLEWALMRPRSERELRDYLRLKKTDFTEEIIAKLVQKGYVDDARFAEYYVENRFTKKGISRRRLQMELTKKGVSQEIIEEVIGGRDEVVEIEKIIAKKRGKYDDEKLIAHLCRQGFSYDLIKEAFMDEE